MSPRGALLPAFEFQCITEPAPLLDLKAKPVLVPDCPQFRTDDPLLVAGACPSLRPVGGDVSIHPDPPHVVVYALAEAKYLHAITQQRVRQPVGAAGH